MAGTETQCQPRDDLRCRADWTSTGSVRGEGREKWGVETQPSVDKGVEWFRRFLTSRRGLPRLVPTVSVGTSLVGWVGPVFGAQPTERWWVAPR